MEDNFFPFFIDLKGKNVLVIGAGKIALRKVKTLLKCGAKILVITREVKENEFFRLCELGEINLKIVNFSDNLLNNIFFVVSATDDENFNREIFNKCEKRNILMNNVTSKIDMNIRFSSVLETKEYRIGVSAKGNPKKAKVLKESLKKILENEC